MTTRTENEVAKAIVDAAFHIHQALGPGLLESVYEVVLARELEKRGQLIERQKAVRFSYEGAIFDEGFRMDMLVDNLVIVELKSVEFIAPVHKKQLVTFLRLANKRLGLLVNFGSALIKNGITRVVNGLEE